MKRKKHRRSRKVVSNVRHHRRRKSAKRAHSKIRRNPARRKSHRKRYKLAVSHRIRRIRMNPPSSGMGGTITTAGGAAGMALLGMYMPKLTTKIMPATATANTKALINGGITLGLGILGGKLLEKRQPALAKGLVVGSLVSAVLIAAAMVSPASAATNGAAAGAGAGQGGSGSSGNSGSGASASNAGASGSGASGSAMSGMAAYLGANPRRRRRGMAAYLGAAGRGRRGRRMNSYLGKTMGLYQTPGQPITSLLGPVSPAARTFGNRAGSLGSFGRRPTALGNLYQAAAAFKSDAWSR